MSPVSQPSDTTTEERPTPTNAARGEPCLCVAFEAERPLQASSFHRLGNVDVLRFGRSRGERTVERRTEGGERQLLLGVPDRWMSGAHASLRRMLGRWVLEDAGSKNGTFVNGGAVRHAELADGDVVELGHSFAVFRAFAPVELGEPLDVRAVEPLDAGLLTLRPALAAQLRDLQRIASTRVSVILRGESGTGKEVLARAVHRLSGRTGPLQAVNCGALPDTLVESELFGYRKGAFSGAYEDRPGLVRSADGGTLFLDEVGDLPLALQASLLRVLQESEVVPVGSTKPVKVDLRVLAATHHNLDEMVASGSFRADLLARLSGFTLTLPPLRERREDLGLLGASLLRRHLAAGAERVRFGQLAARALFLHSWPLNVRELEKSLAVAAALAEDGRIELEHLPPPIRTAPDEGAAEIPAAHGKPLSAADDKRRQELLALLEANQGNVAAVARAIGKARMQVQRWMKRFGIDPASYRG